MNVLGSRLGDEEAFGGEVGIAGEIHAQSSQSGFVPWGGDVGYMDLAAL